MQVIVSVPPIHTGFVIQYRKLLTAPAKRKQQQDPPAPQQADATGSRSGRERDPGQPRPAAPHRAGHGA